MTDPDPFRQTLLGQSGVSSRRSHDHYARSLAHGRERAGLRTPHVFARPRGRVRPQRDQDVQ